MSNIVAFRPPVTSKGVKMQYERDSKPGAESPAEYFTRLRDQGYRISIQGSRQGPVEIKNNRVSLQSVAALPDSVIEAAKSAGAEDMRVGLDQILQSVQGKDTVSVIVNSVKQRLQSSQGEKEALQPTESSGPTGPTQ